MDRLHIERDEHDDPTLTVGKALADPTRLAVLRAIERAAAPMTIRALVEQFALHPNAIRKHLALLVDSGLVREEIAPPQGAGRPPHVYAPNPDRPTGIDGWNPYEALASLLVDVASGRDAREVGAEYGRALADAAPERDPLDVLVGISARHGFDPLVEHDDEVAIVLRRCPFASAVRGDGIVCALHRGIADGIAAARRTAPIELETTSPAVGPCRYRLAPCSPSPDPDSPLPRAGRALEALR